MSIKLFENKESKRIRNVKRDDVRKPNIDSSKMEKLLEEKAILLKEKEQRESSKKKGFR